MTLEPVQPVLRLSADGAEARTAISAATDTLVQNGRENPRLRVVLGGESLSAPTIATLISALRRLREFGGALELSGETEAVRAIIHLNGLERVFAFPLAASDEPVPQRKRGGLGGMFRGAAAAIAVIVALAGPSAPARADTTDTDPAAILARVMQRNPALSSYQSRLHVDIRLISFPYISQHLEGSTYFKRPANYEVVFDRVPSYAKGFEKLYSDVGDPANWDQRFAITYAGREQFENRSDIALHMVQRVRGMIDHETVLIDPAGWTIDRIRYDYYNGGVITMTQHFTVLGGNTMLSSQLAEIHIPHVRAVANGTYTDYQTNVAISDSVFVKKN